MNTTWSKRPVTWTDGGVLHVSVVFTWHLTAAKALAEKHPGRVVAGGPAAALCGCDGWAELRAEAPEGVEPVAMHNPEATFTTRGCVRRCSFCAVPRTEGAFRELTSWTPRRLVCDNQLLAASRAHLRRVVRGLLPIEGVDFNQGLDARLFRSWHAEMLSRLKKPKMRFALDHVDMTDVVGRAVALAREHGLRDIGVFVLVGFQDTPEDALTRLETVRGWGLRPNPMRYQPLDARVKNRHVASTWTTDMLQDVMRYYSRLRWLEGVSFQEYRDHEVKRRFLSRLRGRAPRRLGRRG